MRLTTRGCPHARFNVALLRQQCCRQCEHSVQGRSGWERVIYGRPRVRWAHNPPFALRVELIALRARQFLICYV